MRIAVTTPDAAPVDVGALYRTHAHKVARWVERLGGPGIDLEDTVHEVFEIAHRRLPSFRGEASVSTWLFGIADLTVRHRRRKERWRRWLGGSAEDTAGRLAAPGVDQQADLERREAVASVYQVLDRLGERDRQTLILFELEELTAEEVAGLLGIKAANARLRLHRARQRFLHEYEAWERRHPERAGAAREHEERRSGHALR